MDLAAMEKMCPNCRTLLPKQANHCMTCGNTVPADAPAASSYAYWSQAPEEEVRKLYRASYHLRLTYTLLLFPILLIPIAAVLAGPEPDLLKGWAAVVVLFAFFFLAAAFVKTPWSRFLIRLFSYFGFFVGGVTLLASIAAGGDAVWGGGFPGLLILLFAFIMFFSTRNKNIFSRIAPRHRQLQFLIKPANRGKTLSEDEWKSLGKWQRNLYSYPAIAFYLLVIVEMFALSFPEVWTDHGKVGAQPETPPAAEQRTPTPDQVKDPLPGGAAERQ